MKVSVIVPVYNVEKYINKCLKSLVNQTLKDIEIIVVNDGSPDNSQKIIDEYAKKYKNIKSYIKENGGVSDARNFGIEKSSGEYIAFVDGDDFVLNDMYEKMYEKAKSNNFDIVVCDLNYIYEDDNSEMKVSSGFDKDTTDIKKAIINNYPVVWNKIIKREIFNNIKFKKGVWFEDVEFLYRMFPLIKSIGVVKEAFNQYIQRKGSITKSVDKRIYNYIDNWNGIIDFYKEKGFYDEYKKEIEFAYVRYIYATFVKQSTYFDKEEYNNAVDLAIKNVKKNFPHYKRNKYFYRSLKGIYLLVFNKIISKILYKIKNR